MADNKKYYYMRLKEDFFDSEEMILLEAMPDGVLYQNILLKMYCRSLKNEGRLMLNGIIPYNSQMLAALTRQQIGVVEKALQVLQQLGLIEVLDNGAIYMLNIQNFIGSSSTEGDRKRKYRNDIDTEKKLIGQMSGQISTRDRDIDITKDIDRDIYNARARADAPADEEKTTDKVPYKKIMDLYHSICKSYPTIRDINGERKKAVAARYKANPDLDVFKKLFEKAEASKFLQGNNDRNWKADFDFMMHAAKFDRILEGKYDDSEQNKPTAKPTSYDTGEVEAITMNKYQKYAETGVLDFNFEVKK